MADKRADSGARMIKLYDDVGGHIDVIEGSESHRAFIVRGYTENKPSRKGSNRLADEPDDPKGDADTYIGTASPNAAAAPNHNIARHTNLQANDGLDPGVEVLNPLVQSEIDKEKLAIRQDNKEKELAGVEVDHDKDRERLQATADRLSGVVEKQQDILMQEPADAEKAQIQPGAPSSANLPAKINPDTASVADLKNFLKAHEVNYGNAGEARLRELAREVLSGD